MKGFGKGNLIALRCASLAVLTVMAWAGVGLSDAAEPPPSGGQPALDLIAGIPFDGVFKQLGAPTPPTGPFSTWTAAQQKSFPVDLERLCAGFWTFIDGAPKSRGLPASLSDTDKVALVMDICLVAHMPADWPERRPRLQAATAILKQANQAGAPLHLPEALTR